MSFSRSAAMLALGLLAACAHGPRDGGGQPEVYRGPLTVVAAQERPGGTRTYRSEGQRTRVTLESRGRTFDHVVDGVSRRTFTWTSDKPDVEARRMRKPPPRYWLWVDDTEPGEACTAAGETGRIWRHTSPPNFKNPDATITAACLTPDGVMLAKYVGHPPGAAPILEWEATSVVRGPLPADALVPPAAAGAMSGAAP